MTEMPKAPSVSELYPAMAMTGDAPPIINVSEGVLADLRLRLRHTRWPQQLENQGWSYGTDAEYLRQLVNYWIDEYDWRAEERRLNQYRHYRELVDGFVIHFVRVSPQLDGMNPTGTRPAILLLHGWPGSFVQMLDLAELLANPVGASAGDTIGHEVIIGSLPGYGFSEPATSAGMNETTMATLFGSLMSKTLGFERYMVHGSDFGAGIASEMAVHFPEHLIGVHLSGTSPRADGVTVEDSPALQRYAQEVAHWRESEVGYSALQSTKPATLATALNDSPAGLASWIIEKFRRWSDCGGDVEKRFTKEQLLTNVMVYWISGSIGSSIRGYRESAPDSDLRNARVPIAYLMSDRDMLHTPREWVERTSRIDRWTQVDRGGHFIEWEEPSLVCDDIREFLASFPERPEAFQSE